MVDPGLDAPQIERVELLTFDDHSSGCGRDECVGASVVNIYISGLPARLVSRSCDGPTQATFTGTVESEDGLRVLVDVLSWGRGSNHTGGCISGIDDRGYWTPPLRYAHSEFELISVGDPRPR